MLNLPAAILFVSGITGLVMTLILMVIAKSYPKYIRGVTEWSYAILMASFAMFLFLGRGHVADFFSIIIANVILLWAFIQINTASKLMADKKPWLVGTKLIATLASFTALCVWFTYITPSVTSRVLLLTAFLMPIVIEQFFFILKQMEKSPGKSVMLISLALVLVGRILRTIMALNGKELPGDFFENTLVNIISVAIHALTIPLTTISCIMLASERLHRELEYSAQHDDLTGLLNKRAISNLLEREIKRSKRLKNNLTVMLLDLDDFKTINDQHGHLIGDKVLIDFAKKSKSTFREADHLSRFGGDEFIAVLPDTSVKQAELIAKRINQAGKLSDPAWSTSVGIAQFSETDTFETLLTKADGALYQAKMSGKNKAHISSAK